MRMRFDSEVSTLQIRLLVVESDPAARGVFHKRLQAEGFDATRCDSTLAARDLIASGAEFDVVLADLSSEGLLGISFCEWLARTRPHLPVIVLTRNASVELAVAALRAKVFDFFEKAVEFETIVASIRSAALKPAAAVEPAPLRSTTMAPPEGEGGALGIFGESPKMRELVAQIQRTAATGSTVLIRGEIGTGKALVARAVHDASPRGRSPFIALNCAAIAKDVTAADLFGDGARTDERAEPTNLIGQARGGTLFLEEVGELPLYLQPSLLRALKMRSEKNLSEVRVVAASSQDLRSLVEAGRFREDLFYQLNVVELKVPALRECGEDVLVYAEHFLAHYATMANRSVPTVSGDAAERLMAYDWPGNLRELENTIEQVVVLTKGDEVAVSDLPDAVRQARRKMRSGERLLSLSELERRHIESALEMAGGNKTVAAKILGIDRRTLYRKAERRKSRTGS